MANPFGDEEIEGSSANPFGDQAISGPGIATAAKRGFAASTVGDAALEMRAAADEIEKLDLEISSNGPGAERARARKSEIHGFMKDSAGRMVQGQQDMSVNPASPEYQDFQAQKGLGPTLRSWAKAPVKNTMEIVAESLGAQAKTLPLTVASAAAGPVGLGITAGAASAKAEYGQGLLELLVKNQVDINDPDAVTAALNSPQFKAAQGEKLKKAAVVGAIDGLTAGVAGVKIGKTQAANIPAQAGIQAGGGMTGEAVGSVAAGEEVSWPAVVAEGIGEMPGAMIDVGALALSKRALQVAGEAKEHEAITGLAPAQRDVVEDLEDKRVKPKLSPLQSKIVVAAAQAGLDPQAVLTIASIETGGKFNPDAKNPTSSAHGLFQQLDATWKGTGGGDRNDPDLQIVNGIRGIQETAVAMRKSLGRDATGHELYMGHLFGPSMGAFVIDRSQQDPQGQLIDAIRARDPKNADAIVKNNGLAGMTNEQAYNKILGWYSQHNRRMGGDGMMNEMTHASPQADAAPSPEGKSTDEMLDEIDAVLAEAELSPPTPADIEEARAELGEDTSIETVSAPSEIDEFVEDEVAAMTIEPVPPPVAVLPRELAGASPRYGVGNRLFQVQFESDVDRAAYIIANGAKRSERDADYLKFVMDNSGMTEEEARNYGQGIRRNLGAMAKAEKRPEVDVLKVPAHADALAESGTSMAELATRKSVENPNDRVALPALPVVDDEQNNLRTRKIQPGEVVAAGIDSEQTPVGYMRAVRDTMQEFVSTFAPTARLMLTFKTEEDGRVSDYRPMSRVGKNVQVAGNAPGLYRINMRNAKNLGVGQDSTTNSTTQRKITYATYHELGHMLADHEFTRGMGPETLAKFRARGEEAIGVYFDDADFSTLEPSQIAVLQEYNELKRRVLEDPKMTVSRFMDAWLSPWKLSFGGGKDQGKVSFLRHFYGNNGQQQLLLPAKHFARTMHLDRGNDILSPHEYFAEQTARYAYSSKLAENSPLAHEFFMSVLNVMRKFFAKLKRQGDIRPGVAFAEWMDSLTSITKNTEGIKNPAKPPVEVEKKPRKPRVVLKKKPAAAPAEPEAPSMLAPPDTLMKVVESTISTALPDHVQQAMQLLEQNSGLRSLEKNLPSKYKHFKDLVLAGRIDDFVHQASVYMSDDEAGAVRWDTDNPEHMQWAEVEQRILKAMPQRAGLKHWFGNGMRWLSDRKHMVMTMRQMAFAHPNLAGIQTIEMMMTQYKAYKAKLELRGLEAADRWGKLGKEQAGLLESAMKEEHYNGVHVFDLQVVNKTWRFVPTADTLSYAAAKGLDDQALKVWLDVKNAHLQHMNALQNVLRQKIKMRYANRPKTQAVKVAELHQMFQAIRATPFIPQTRFGEYALRVMEKTGEGNRPVHIEFFESAAMRDEARAHLQANVGANRTVEPVHFAGSSHLLRTLPPQLLSTYALEFDLTDYEKKQLREIYDPITSNPQTRRYSQQLAAITGANKNLHRNFADFMWHDSNNIAKLAHSDHLKKGVRMVAEDMHKAALDGDFATHDMLKPMLDFAHRYVQHMLNPADEWQIVRSFVVLKMLWGNLKTALVNVTSVVNVWSVAATEGGLIAGTTETSKAMLQQLTDSITRTGQRILRQPVEGGQVFNADQRWAMNQAKVDGLLDESFAAQLAQFANSGTLSRLNMPNAEKNWRKAIWAGMLPQHAVEHYTRRVTLQTMFDIYMKKGMKKEDAYAKAKRDTYLLQGDNTIMNRPAFMRGKLALVTIFYGYVQNMLYLMSGGQERARNLRNAIDSGATANLTTAEAWKKFRHIHAGGETVKMWMAYAALGGVMGLPGAEDLDKVMELVAKMVFGQRFSLKEYMYEMASTISEQASEFGVDIHPRSIVHGGASNINMFGMLPAVDISSSISLGQALPGTGGLDKLGQRGGSEAAFLAALGPLGSTMKQFGDLFGDDPGMMKKFGIFVPNTFSNMWKAIDEHEKAVRFPSGGKVTTDLVTGEVRDLTLGETVARLAGFQPSVVTANRELHWMQKDAQTYWTHRRNGLLQQAWEAKLHGDREAIADAKAAVEEFNGSVMDPALKLTGKDLVKSAKIRRKTAQKDERREARMKKYEQLFGDIEGNFTGDRD